MEWHGPARQIQAPPISACDHRPLAWLYFRFPLSLRLVEEMLVESGIVVSYETVRRWGMKFGADHTRRPKRKRPEWRGIWHLDEVVIAIGGTKQWLWRAVDQNGYVLDETVQRRRDIKTAGRLVGRLPKKQGCRPRRMITDKLGSYAAARRHIMSSLEHRSHKGLNNRAENPHVPLRKRERTMQGFRSSGGLQRFVAVFSAVRNLFVPPVSSLRPCHPSPPAERDSPMENRGRYRRLSPQRDRIPLVAPIAT